MFKYLIVITLNMKLLTLTKAQNCVSLFDIII